MPTTKDEDHPEPPSVRVAPTQPSADDESPERPDEDLAGEDLAGEDEAVLRELGRWLHEREAAEVTGLDLVIPPPPPPLSDAELEARVDALFGPRRRKIARKILSHLAVAAAAVLAVQLGSKVLDRTVPGPKASYSLDLRGGDGQAFAPSEGDRIYSPHSTFELKLRPDRITTEPIEVLITACREGAECDRGTFRIRLGPEALEHNDRGGLHYEAPASTVLPLAPGRWTLTFAVGEPGACLLAAPEPPCREIGRSTVEIRGLGSGDAR